MLVLPPCLSLQVLLVGLHVPLFRTAQGKYKTRVILLITSCCSHVTVKEDPCKKGFLWIYKLSDIQRSGEKILLPQESEMCHLPRVRNRKRERCGSLVDFISHFPSNPPGSHNVDLQFHFGVKDFICLCVWTQMLLSFSFCFSAP